MWAFGSSLGCSLKHCIYIVIVLVVVPFGSRTVTTLQVLFREKTIVFSVVAERGADNLFTEFGVKDLRQQWR